MSSRPRTRVRGPLPVALLLAAGAMLVAGCTGAGADSAPGPEKVSQAPVADRRPVADAPVTPASTAQVSDPTPAPAAEPLVVQVLPGADLPVVTIRAVADASVMVNDDRACSNISAASLGRGELEVARTGSLDTALTVHYTTSGTSSANGDAEALPNEVTIPAGASTASVWVTPSSAHAPAPLHLHRSGTLALTLADTDAYDVGAAPTAEIALHFDIDLFGCDPPQ